MFDNIPHEMRQYCQWVVWRYEETLNGKQTKVPYNPNSGYPASVTNPGSWGTYDQAIATCYQQNFNGIGFVLTENDPYAFIDLDEPKGLNNQPLSQEEHDKILNRQKWIAEEFNSYAELSPSGNGLHIIVRGTLPSGRKRSCIEVYSSARFMTMTGNVYRQSGIVDFNEAINALWGEMGRGQSAEMFYAGLADAVISDDEVIRIASTAKNGELFKNLFYAGNWQQHYPSQSEADFSLIDIIAFYSKNGAQTKRIFLMSKLAEREKSRADYRIAYMLNRCFDTLLPPIDIEGLRDQLNAAIEKAKRPAEVVREMSAEKFDNANSEFMPISNDSPYTVPPGLVGEIAQFIHRQAQRPVAEIALAGAIGLMCGIVGRAYNVSGTGLNQYVLLLGNTGSGKEAIHTGISKLMTEVKKIVPTAEEFIGPGEIASFQAIFKYMAAGKPSLVSQIGEFGLYLQNMAVNAQSPHTVAMRRFLLDVFNKSGEGQKMNPFIYSDKEKNTGSILSPAFSIIGESTPERFYGCLSEDLINDGLLPRFTIIEYNGPRVKLNVNHADVKPGFELIQKLGTVCANVQGLNAANKVINVYSDPDAQEILHKFDVFCDNQINTGAKESIKQLWNRAHIKALKMAALVAVGCNYFNPVITKDIAEWAIRIVESDVKAFMTRFKSGEVGTVGDDAQVKKLTEIIRDYITLEWNQVKSYINSNNAKALHDNKIVAYAYMQKRSFSSKQFYKDRMGSTVALKRAIQILCDSGSLQELSSGEIIKSFGYNSKAYAVKNIEDFL